MKKTGFLLIALLIGMNFWGLAGAEAAQDCSICHGNDYQYEKIDRNKVCYGCHLPHEDSSSTQLEGTTNRIRLNYAGDINDLDPTTLSIYHESIVDKTESVGTPVSNVNPPPTNGEGAETTVPLDQNIVPTDAVNQANPSGVPIVTTVEATSDEFIKGTIAPTGETILQSSKGALQLVVPSEAIKTTMGKTVKVNITVIPKQELDNLLSGTTVPVGVKLMGKGLELRAEAIVINKLSEPITSFERPVTFTIQLSASDLQGVHDPSKVGLFKLEEDGKLTFIGGKYINGKLVVQMLGFSKCVLGVVDISFKDTANHWAKQEIALIASKYIVKGYPEGVFNPDGAVTRAEFAAMLVQAIKLPASSVDAEFSDVQSQDWYHNSISTAFQAGIIKGFNDGTFRPNSLITREEVAVMIAQALKTSSKAAALNEQEVENTLAVLSDRSKIAEWARKDLALAIKQGIVNGTTVSTVTPQAGATRAEAAVMIARFWAK